MSGESIVGAEPLHRGWLRLSAVTVRLGDGTEYVREIEDHGDAACVLPYDPERRTAWLVRQLRTPMLFKGAADAYPLEAPAGLMDESDPEETARREAFEEAGLRLGSLERVADVWTSPGFTCERLTLFLAACSAADRAGAGGGLADEHEQITVVELPLAELRRLADEGGIADMKTLALIFALRLRHPDLFD